MGINVSTLSTVLTGIGLGSILAAVIQQLLARRAKHSESLFNERKAAFEHFLMNYADIAFSYASEKYQQQAVTIARIELVASQQTIDSMYFLLRIDRASEDYAERVAHAKTQLLHNMRNDLGLS
ncbi:hypothetical protein RF663_18680 [Aeromonas veronii]|uniref:hypothetical protein n=1 Tax=Aeromonas veronii TaxID=654 RepID=UPI0028531AEF|nr:hypothetical protein [Aeromonas veronii]MDR5016243.1 hypothetical protein [Aeromonas veronii]